MSLEKEYSKLYKEQTLKVKFLFHVRDTQELECIKEYTLPREATLEKMTRKCIPIFNRDLPDFLRNKGIEYFIPYRRVSTELKFSYLEVAYHFDKKLYEFIHENDPDIVMSTLGEEIDSLDRLLYFHGMRRKDWYNKICLINEEEEEESEEESEEEESEEEESDEEKSEGEEEENEGGKDMCKMELCSDFYTTLTEDILNDLLASIFCIAFFDTSSRENHATYSSCLGVLREDTDDYKKGQYIEVIIHKNKITFPNKSEYLMILSTPTCKCLTLKERSNLGKLRVDDNQFFTASLKGEEFKYYLDVGPDYRYSREGVFVKQYYKGTPINYIGLLYSKPLLVKNHKYKL